MLSESINQYPERDEMRVMFLRESEGVYTFGSKRVYIKIDKGEMLSCRVGGGFISIHEFIRQQTPIELKKLEQRRHNVIDRFRDKI